MVGIDSAKTGEGFLAASLDLHTDIHRDLRLLTMREGSPPLSPLYDTAEIRPRISLL